MRILFLSQRFVLPMDTGGKIRTGKLLEQLRRQADITLVSNVDDRTDGPYLTEIDRLCTKFVAVPWRELPRHSWRYYARLVGYSLNALPVTAQNDYSRPLKRAVETELATGQYDLAICDFVQSARMFSDVVGVPTLLFQHNVESEIARRHTSEASNWLSRMFWRAQWQRMTRFEGASSRAFDSVVAVSAADAALMKSLYGIDHVETIPTGVDADYYQEVADETASPGELVFCGSMDWLPNEDAMEFFIVEVLPRIRTTVPTATCTIVGRNPSPTIERLVRQTPGVVLTGWVEDTRPYIARGQVCIVPIRVGGGTRMKMYEGMAMGRAVVSTTIGAEGLAYDDGANIMIADGAEAFAAATVSLLRDDGRRRVMATAARRHVEHNFSWSRVADVFLDICRRTSVGPS